MERAYRDMYLECDSKAERARAFTAARRLTDLVARVDRGSALALDHLVQLWVDKGEITPAVIQVSIDFCINLRLSTRQIP